MTPTDFRSTSSGNTNLGNTFLKPKTFKNNFQLRFCWKKCWNSLRYTQIAAKLDVTLSSVIFEKNHAQHSQTYEIWWTDPQKSWQDSFFDLSRVQKRVQHLSFTRTSGAEVCGGQMRGYAFFTHFVPSGACFPAKLNKCSLKTAFA